MSRTDQYTITAVRQGDHITVPASDNTGYVGHDAETDGLHFSLEGSDGGCFFVPVVLLHMKLAELGLLIVPAPPPLLIPAPAAPPPLLIPAPAAPPPQPAEPASEAPGRRRRRRLRKRRQRR